MVLRGTFPPWGLQVGAIEALVFATAGWDLLTRLLQGCVATVTDTSACGWTGWNHVHLVLPLRAACGFLFLKENNLSQPQFSHGRWWSMDSTGEWESLG